MNSQKSAIWVNRMTKLVVLQALTIVLFFMSSGTTSAFCFGLLCPGGAGGHYTIIGTALPFLRTTILNDINEQNRFQDFNRQPWQSHHFDGCKFEEATTYINEEYSRPRTSLPKPFGEGGVLAEFDPNSPEPFNASKAFGRLLHTIQDFYAHSNWVDYDPIYVPLIDTGTGPWTILQPWEIVSRGDSESLVVVQGEKEDIPENWVLEKTEVEGHLKRGVKVTIPERPSIRTVSYNGLVSGYNDLIPVLPDDCPGHPFDSDSEMSNATFSHSELNKDNRDRPNHTAAFEAAVDQTKHEWCRLLYLLKDEYPNYAGTSLPMALWVKSTEHPSSAFCKDDLEGDIEVTISITSIKVVDDTDPDHYDHITPPGELNFVFVVYTGEFTYSVGSQTGIISVNSGDFIPTSALPSPLRIYLKQDETLVVTVQGWDDHDQELILGDDPDRELNPGKYNSSDDTLIGITESYSGPNFGSGQHIAESKDMVVEFEISVQR